VAAPVAVEARFAGASEPRPPGAKLVHDLNGSLAAIGLHLHLAADGNLPARSAENLRNGLAAVRQMREQMAELAELLSKLPPRARSAPPRSS
jgi:hypothetical protein